MYCLRVKILTLVTIGYIVGFIVGMYIEYCLWAQVAVLDIYCIYWTVWERYMQVLYLGRAPRTKETLPNFLKWRRVTRPPLVFRRLTGSQRTPGFWGVTPSTRGIPVDVGLPDATLENQAESPLYGELYPNTVPAYTCPKQSNIYNIYPIRPLGPTNSTQCTCQL